MKLRSLFLSVLPIALAAPATQITFIDEPIKPNLVPVQLGVMSKCPDAFACEAAFDSVLDQTASLVSPSLSYIGTLNSTVHNGVSCMHGPSECRGNMQQLCFAEQHREDWKTWWNFVQCMRWSPSRIGDDSLARDCAKLVKVNWDDGPYQDCVDGKQGARLLRESVKQSKAMGIKYSCSILINDKIVCVRDGGRYVHCDSGHEIGDFVNAIRSAYKAIN